MNEFLLILSLPLCFGLTLLWLKLFGKNGLFCFTAIATIAANIEVLILVKAFGLEQTLGNVLFASTFLMTDILSECFGKKDANKAVWVGFAANISFILLSQLWLQFTPSAGDSSFSHIKAIFSQTPRLMLASLLAYVVCQFFDVWIYHKIWKASGGGRKKLWLRNNGSTLISQLLNAVLFNAAAFMGIMDIRTLTNVIISSYLIFVITSFADTPFVYLARRLVGNNNVKGE